MIDGMIGRPGSGKTYLMVARALRQLKQGRTVFANFGMKGTAKFGPEDLMVLPPGLVLIDEAHLWFPARGAMYLPPSWLAMVSQTRKSGWDIWWTAQHERRVDSALKDVSNWFFLCSAWLGGPGSHPLLFRTKSWEPELFRRKNAHMSTSWYPYRDEVAKCYDTYERVDVAQHAKKKDDQYAAAAASRTKSGLFVPAGAA